MLPYSPKDKKDFKKIFNNIYVKNIPDTWDEEKLREVFSKYGPIYSLKMMTTKKDEQSPESKFAFVCFYDPANNEVGPISAAKAIDQENG